MVERLARLVPQGRTSGYAQGPKETACTLRVAPPRKTAKWKLGGDVRGVDDTVPFETSRVLPYSSIAPPIRRRCLRKVYDGSVARLAR